MKEPGSLSFSTAMAVWRETCYSFSSHTHTHTKVRKLSIYSEIIFCITFKSLQFEHALGNLPCSLAMSGLYQYLEVSWTNFTVTCLLTRTSTTKKQKKKKKKKS